jgi:hypothetical protein
MRAERDAPALWVTAGAADDPWAVCEGAATTVELEKVRSLYCATKPMVAMGVLALLERSGVDWTEARLDAGGRLRDDGPWAVSDLLARRTPLVRPTFWEVLRLPCGHAEPVLRECAQQAAATCGGRPGTSEVLVWYLLAEIAAGVAGAGWAGAFQGDLRAVLGPRLWLVPDRELLDLPVDAMATLTAEHQGADVPLVYALTVRSRALTSPSLGGYGSFAAVVSWFAALGRHLRSDSSASTLFPDAARLRAALAAVAVAGDDDTGAVRPAVGLEVVIAEDGRPRVGLQAAGGALCVELDPATGAVLGVLGSRFLAETRRRRAWLATELAAARAWAEQIHARST